MKIWMLPSEIIPPNCTVYNILFLLFFSKYGMYSEHGFLFLDIRSRRTPAKANWFFFWNCIECSKKVICMFRCKNINDFQKVPFVHTFRGRSQTTLTSCWLFMTTYISPCVDIFYLINVDKMSKFLGLPTHLFLPT